jgi:hypothetical protein
MRLERQIAGVYAWPEMQRPAMLPKPADSLTP